MAKREKRRFCPKLNGKAKIKMIRRKPLKCKRAIVFAAAFIIINTESFSHSFEILPEEF